MNPKITPDHLGRAAVVYVRQSTMAHVTGNLESQRRQYDLAKAAEAASVTVIDDDLGRSGSGTMQRPGFERLVAMACSGGWCGVLHRGVTLGAQRAGLASSHRLVRACRRAGCRGAYDPRIVNDRLLLGLKGTMSEYELSVMRQRGIAAAAGDRIESRIDPGSRLIRCFVGVMRASQSSENLQCPSTSTQSHD